MRIYAEKDNAGHYQYFALFKTISSYHIVTQIKVKDGVEMGHATLLMEGKKLPLCSIQRMFEYSRLYTLPGN